MKDKRLLVSFFVTVFLAVLLRFFIVDFILVSNDVLQPQFFPGDFLLISKISSVEEGQWALLKDYPEKGIYTVRMLVKKDSDQGWKILEPVVGSNQTQQKFVGNQQIIGRAQFILWSLPCKPSAVANGLCPEKGTRFFKSVN